MNRQDITERVRLFFERFPVKAFTNGRGEWNAYATSSLVDFAGYLLTSAACHAGAAPSAHERAYDAAEAEATKVTPLKPDAMPVDWRSAALALAEMLADANTELRALREREVGLLSANNTLVEARRNAEKNRENVDKLYSTAIADIGPLHELMQVEDFGRVGDRISALAVPFARRLIEQRNQAREDVKRVSGDYQTAMHAAELNAGAHQRAARDLDEMFEGLKPVRALLEKHGKYVPGESNVGRIAPFIEALIEAREHYERLFKQSSGRVVELSNALSIFSTAANAFADGLTVDDLKINSRLDLTVADLREARRVYTGKSKAAPIGRVAPDALACATVAVFSGEPPAYLLTWTEPGIFGGGQYHACVNVGARPGSRLIGAPVLAVEQPAPDHRDHGDETGAKS